MGDSISAADIVIFPSLQILLRALAKPEARDLSSRFLPLDVNYPALSRWIARVEALPGYEKTYPPHWRDAQRREVDSRKSARGACDIASMPAAKSALLPPALARAEVCKHRAADCGSGRTH